MARLTLNLAAQTLAVLEMQEGIAYNLGRAKDSDLVIPEEPGISRRHLELEPQGNTWKLKMVARYGDLYVNSKRVSEIQLDQNLSFEMPPYRFEFQTSFQQTSDMPLATSSAAGSQFTNEPTQILIESSKVDVSEMNTSVSGTNDDESAVAPLSDSGEPANPNSAAKPGHEPTLIRQAGEVRTETGQTSIAPISLMGVLKLFDDRGSVVRIYKLEGEEWLAGRSEECPIFIEHPKVSRKQFELRRSTNSFLIRDLGSANGTSLNASLLPKGQWVPVSSGDLIQVLDVALQFEVVNPATFSEEDVLKSANEPLGFMNPKRLIRSEKKPLYLRIAIGVLLAGALVFAFMNNDETPAKPQEAKKASGAADAAYAKLTPAQQDYVRDSYMAAERLYKSGHYQMAEQEMIKVHQMVPAYQNSKDIEKNIQAAINIEKQREQIEKEQREATERQAKIKEIVKRCEAKLNPQITSDTMRDCLAETQTLDPTNPEAEMLIGKAAKIEDDRKVQEAQHAEYQDRVQKRAALFERAEDVLKSGNRLSAIKAFNEVIESSLPDPNNLKGRAERKIASITKSLSEDQAKYESEGDELVKKSDLKNAVIAYKKAIEINPENETVQGKKSLTLGDLRKQMQQIYQEGILEESVGEVETARNKWRKIIDQSLPEEDYYKKAYLKLKKYGAN